MLGCNIGVPSRSFPYLRFYSILPADVWGIITLTVATCYYFQYNWIVFHDMNDTTHSMLYLRGDYWYLVNAGIYTLCAMRWAWICVCVCIFVCQCVSVCV